MKKVFVTMAAFMLAGSLTMVNAQQEPKKEGEKKEHKAGEHKGEQKTGEHKGGEHKGEHKGEKKSETPKN